MARATVVVTPASVTITTAGAQARITRVPFRISIATGNRQTSLAEVPNAGALPAVLTPSAYPVPLGGKPEPENDLYAPLTFLVGTETTTQWGGGPVFFQGNEQAGLVTGIQYAARNVLSAQPVGSGARLVLSTSDPTGRQLIVDVSPGPGSTIRVDASPSPSAGVALMSDSFASGPAEQFHGFGGRHNAINQHGNDFYSWIEQENSSGLPNSGPIENAAAGQANYQFPDGPGAAYTAQALFYSSHPYGFLLDQPDFARWRMDSDRSNAWQVSAYGTRLNYVVAPGPAATAISAITSITGRERVPPTWAIAPEVDRVVRARNAQTPAEAASEISSDLATIARYHLPVRAYRPEAWTLLDAAAQQRFMHELRSQKIQLMRYFRAFVAYPTGGFEPDSDYSYAVSHGFVATNANGGPATFGSPYANGTGALIDFSNPAAVSWWQGRIRTALDQGADGFMQDYGEQVDVGWRFHDGETGATMHNRYPILYDQATRQVLDQYEQQHPGRHIFFFTRAGYSGAPGSAAYENAEFLGDNTTSWDHASGIASVIPDMLNRGVGGAFGSTTDIGGYLDLLTGKTTKELLIRWAELAALTPFYRLHNSGYAGTQMPWAFDPQTFQTYEAMARLHIDAEPLILKLWKQADQSGTPIMQPLWLAYPGDPQAAEQDEEWMLGPDVLVAPVVTQAATTRSVYFPAGCWLDPQTGDTHLGLAAVTVQAPLQTVPYYFRCGTRPFATQIPTPGCPPPTGRLTPAAIGPIKLGMTRSRARRALPHSTRRTTRSMDFFCLAGIGIRVGYPSATLLHTLAPAVPRRLRGTVVLALTANHYYNLRGVHPGARLRAVAHHLVVGPPAKIGLNTWYLCPNGTNRGVLKVRNGIIEEIGIADRQLTPNRHATLRFLNSFD